MTRIQEQSINAFIGALLQGSSLVRKSPDEGRETVQEIISKLKTLRPLFKELDFSENPPADEKSKLKGDLIFYLTRNLARLLAQQAQYDLALQLMEELGRDFRIAAPAWMCAAIEDSEIPALRRSCEEKGLDTKPKADTFGKHYTESSLGRRSFLDDEVDPYFYQLSNELEKLRQNTLSKEEITYSLLTKLEEWQPYLSLFTFSPEEPQGEVLMCKAGDILIMYVRNITTVISGKYKDKKLALRLMTTVQTLFADMLPKWEKELLDNDIAALSR